MLNLKSVKTQLVLFLVCFAIFLSFKDKDTAFLLMTAIAVLSAVLTESCIGYFKTKTFRIAESAIIAGLIVGYVLSSDGPWWWFTCAAALAIVSKNLIHLGGKHIFNPAALGIFITLIVFDASTQWKGTYLWPVLLPAGIYFIYKLKKTEVMIGYGIIFLLLFWGQAALQGVPLVDIFGYLSYFYVFIMVIEPKTTPAKPVPKLLFGGCLVGLIFILTEMGVNFDVELFSLLVMNLTVPFLSQLTQRKRGSL
ncbi:MAG TPA: RnfABCDGE type electron transport complex subunit D [Candidatus Omnitrophota bacterium]|nr:RnfABCDGE type electron transport complex subunit D [Candidatus Omnitrophota bacterium]HPD85402.1 RnfABCDGE type electron transport complex subunit D [Candidatus Omnitrophota bacterium]HRZ04097.1 RnfABCDGE type electron transport complex subunit D [Candidatus Omnitrophota bacterium]